MSIVYEPYFIAFCIEGFLYGKICSSTCTLAKEVQLFPGLGLYSGIFAMYLQCPSKRSGTAIIHFYAVCLLYVLSTASFVCDLAALILQVSNNSICKNTFLYINCADASVDTIVSTSNRLTANIISHFDNPSHSKRLLWLPCSMYSSTHKEFVVFFVPVIRFSDLNLQRFTVVGSCGVKISVSWSFLHSWQLHT